MNKSLYFLLVTVLLFFADFSLFAQDSIPKVKFHKAWVSSTNRPRYTKGVLWEIKDFSIFISSIDAVRKYLPGKLELSDYHFYNIEMIKIRKNKSIGNGILIGAVTGIVPGGLIGYLQEDDPPCKPYISTGDPLADVFGGFVHDMKSFIYNVSPV